MSTNMREMSRTQWTTDGTRTEDINCGSLMRIADATEKMAQRHTELMAERDRYYKYWQDAEQRAGRWVRVNSALKGQITKLKKARHP